MTFADILEQRRLALLGKMASKVPSWAGFDLEYPSSLSTEQCSSEETAAYKAAVVLALGSRVADLTGGLGVDSWAFSRGAEAVWYNEMNVELRAAVERNFERLGACNVSFNSYEIGRPEWAPALRAFRPDVIYLDPARRDAQGRKVFRIEDCSPDVLALLPELLDIAAHVVVKLSPMADISVLQRAFEGHLSRIYVVQSGAEVKELLCVLARRSDGVSVQTGDFVFTPGQESGAVADFASEFGEYLYEPSAALMKTGAFKLICERFGLRKLAPSTHLYTGPALKSPLLKRFRILEVSPLGSFKDVGSRYPHADVSARNVPIRSEELRKRLGITPGPSEGVHIFGCSSLCSGRVLLVCRADFE